MTVFENSTRITSLASSYKIAPWLKSEKTRQQSRGLSESGCTWLWGVTTVCRTGRVVWLCWPVWCTALWYSICWPMRMVIFKHVESFFRRNTVYITACSFACKTMELKEKFNKWTCVSCFQYMPCMHSILYFMKLLLIYRQMNL